MALYLNYNHTDQRPTQIFSTQHWSWYHLVGFTRPVFCFTLQVLEVPTFDTLRQDISGHYLYMAVLKKIRTTKKYLTIKMETNVNILCSALSKETERQLHSAAILHQVLCWSFGGGYDSYSLKQMMNLDYRKSFYIFRAQILRPSYFFPSAIGSDEGVPGIRIACLKRRKWLGRNIYKHCATGDNRKNRYEVSKRFTFLAVVKVL